MKLRGDTGVTGKLLNGIPCLTAHCSRCWPFCCIAC